MLGGELQGDQTVCRFGIQVSDDAGLSQENEFGIDRASTCSELGRAGLHR